MEDYRPISGRKMGLEVKKYFVFLFVLTTILMASTVFADDYGWFLQFELENGSGKEVNIGASDMGTGWAIQNQDYTGLHIGYGAGAKYAGETFYGINTPVETDVYVWSNDSSITEAKIHWFTMGTNYSQGFYYYKPFWPEKIPVQLTLEGALQPEKSVIGSFDGPSEGWLTLPIQESDWESGYKIHLSANAPAVPEPSSLLGLSGGMVGLGGFALRRRR